MAGVKRLLKEVTSFHESAIADHDGGLRPPHVLQVSEWDVIDDPKAAGRNLLPARMRLTVDPPPFFCHDGAGAGGDAVVALDGLRPWPALVGVRLPLDGEYPADYPFKPPKWSVPYDRVGLARELCLPDDDDAGGGVAAVRSAAAAAGAEGTAAVWSPRARTFAGALPVGTHPLDPAPWAPPSERLARVPLPPGRSLASYGPISFAAANLLQQSVRFRIELLGTTRTQVLWRAAMDGFRGLFGRGEARDAFADREASAREKLRTSEDECRREWMKSHHHIVRHSPVTAMDRRIVDAMLLATAAGTSSPLPDASHPVSVKTLTGKTIAAPLRVRVPPQPAAVGKFASSSAAETDFEPDDSKAAAEDFVSVTLMHLNLFLYEREGVPIDCQRLVHGGRRLDGNTRYLEMDFGVAANDAIFMVLRLLGCPHSGLLLPHGDDGWSPAQTLSTHLLPLVNDHLYCADVNVNGASSGDSDAAGCAALWCRRSVQQLLRGAVSAILRCPGGQHMLPTSVVNDSGGAMLNMDLFTDPEHAEDRARIFDAVQWVLRCASPSPLARWSPETDAQWPLLFRKIVRYVRRVRVPTPAADGGATVLPLEVVERVGEFL